LPQWLGLGKETGPLRHKQRYGMPHILNKRGGRRDALHQHVWRPPLSDNTCGGCRAAPVDTAAAAIPKSRGGRHATTPRATLVAHQHVWRPPRRTTCGGGREVTRRAAAAAQQQQVSRPSRWSTQIRAAAAAERQHLRGSPRRARLHGGGSDTRVARRPSCDHNKGDRRSATTSVAAAAPNHVRRRPRSDNKGGGRRTSAPIVAAAAPFHDSTCGGRRSATARAAVAAPRPFTRRPQRYPSRAAAAVQPHQGRPPQRNNKCGGRRVGPRAAAARSDNKGGGRRTAATSVAAVALLHDNTCGDCRSATARAAVAATRPVKRRPQRNNKRCGGRRATRPEAGAARHIAWTQKQVRQPPHNNTKGGGRSVTTSVAATAKRDVRRRPRSDSKGSGRRAARQQQMRTHVGSSSATMTSAAAAAQQQVRLPPRINNRCGGNKSQCGGHLGAATRAAAAARSMQHKHLRLSAARAAAFVQAPQGQRLPPPNSVRSPSQIKTERKRGTSHHRTC